MANANKPTSAAVWWTFDAVFLVLHGVIYAAAFAPAVAILWPLRALALPWLLLIGLACWPVATLGFIVVLAALRRGFGGVPAGRYLLSGKKAVPWLLSSRLIVIYEDSVFRPTITNFGFFRYLFFRLMGARLADKVMFTAPGTVTPEPWGLTIGKRVEMGTQAAVSCHKVEHNVLTYAPVEIGDNVLIGARALVLAGAKIGAHAIIGACSVVLPGTVIPPGEIWVGNPARKVGAIPLPGRKPVALAHAMNHATRDAWLRPAGDAEPGGPR